MRHFGLPFQVSVGIYPFYLPQLCGIFAPLPHRFFWGDKVIIYKYRNCAQRSWEILLNRKLYFATPIQLNDPLDSSIDIQQEYERAKIIVRDSEDYPDGRRSFLMHLLDSHRFKNPLTGERIGLNKAIQEFIQTLGILSFSRTPTDALLWSHYAEGHSGICLGFNTDDFEFKNIFLMDNVQYTTKPPYVELFVSMVDELGEFVRPWDKHEYPPQQGDDFYTSQLSRLMRSNLLVKSEKWKYEEEYRVVTTRPGNHTFPPKALCEVILGTKTHDADFETLKNILSHPDYAHVEIKRVKNVSGTFEFGLFDA
jgi:hypothetical protein